jgi:hypothetical protein
MNATMTEPTFKMMEQQATEHYRVVPNGGTYTESVWHDPEFAERAACRAIESGARTVMIYKMTQQLICEVRRPREESKD